jgi:CheY-like chemotaxis protein
MIFTDYWMPEMTGYELLKKVKVINLTHDTINSARKHVQNPNLF